MTSTPPSGRKSIAKVPNQNVARQPKYVFFFLQTGYIAGLTQDKFCMKQQKFTVSSAEPGAFFTTSKSHEALETTHSRTMASFASPFSIFFIVARTHSIT